MPELALRARGLEKSFPGVCALRAVDFDVRVGEVHGLVGANAAGKSTLVQMLTGGDEPDAGIIEVFGRVARPGDPLARRRAGVAAIYQGRTLVPDLSAAANAFLGTPFRRGPFISRSAARRAFRRVTARLELTIDADAPAGSLSPGDQQMLEIVRALAAVHRILILDEPAGSLGPAERDQLRQTIRALRDEGVATVYVSHDLDEVLALCDRVSVMRDGALVDTRAVRDWTRAGLVTAILGREALAPARPARTIGAGEALRVEGLTLPGVLADVSFSLGRGEVLGLAGLVGSGRTELLRALAGADSRAEGRLFVAGRERPWPRTVRAALALGIALVPEERAQGLVGSMSAVENFWLTDLRRRRQLERAADTLRELDFDVDRLRAPAATLSGGNQQKLVVGKWLHRRPEVLLMDEFTRGIDVGAKAEMHAVVARLAAEGVSILVVSSELEDLVAGADRILVLARGRLAGALGRDEASVERILRCAFAVGRP
jgi:ABC-type sugar transport system ATPase subunit